MVFLLSSRVHQADPLKSYPDVLIQIEPYFYLYPALATEPDPVPQ